ncbi:putative secreted protein [Granulibacter bethesdensis CGDNIH1]|uniref:Secreted protein n=1 Tax=Granulibacter bethesdensis (strain ATCC BAA-1260 / CGDNIH1) TaxID=391165 RepID=Q0BT86_GRABC|nr:putative secreted protein [Granulibacter bethesdensis CGDNIH1]ASV62546.1 putative secreted protein [Granulibacter bethesdensis]
MKYTLITVRSVFCPSFVAWKRDGMTVSTNMMQFSIVPTLCHGPTL